jgi:hypothetical protein
MIGFAPRNDENLALKMHYDVYGDLYEPEPQELDSSKVVSGEEDHYEKVIRL